MAYNPFQVEAWTEYGLGLLVIFLRIFVRCRNVGLNWEGDDYFALLSVFFWTGELLMLELIGRNGSITGMTDEIALTLSEEQIERIIFGSKCLLAGWCIYVTMIWCLKACMLFFYMRLTLNTMQQRNVKITGGVCVAAWFATIVVLLTHCSPIYKLWQVYPYPGDDCALNISNYLGLVVTNVVTDIMILYIPLPLLWQVNIPLKRKLIFGLFLCTGVFIVIATLLRCILCLRDVNSINVGTIWSIRETFVAILAVNTPILKSLFSQTKAKMKTGKTANTGNSYGGGNHALSDVKHKKKSPFNTSLFQTYDDGTEEMMSNKGEYGYSGTVTASKVSVESQDRDMKGIQVKSSYEVA